MKKKHLPILATTILSLSVSPVLAIPTAKSNNSGDYVLGTGLPHRLSAGVYSGSIERDIEYNNVKLPMPLESTYTIAYVGYDLTPWAVVFAGGGIADYDLGSNSSDSSQKWEGGVLLNLVDHEILDPTLFEDKLRVNAGASVAFTKAELFGDDVSWQELTAFATVSIVNDTVGNIFFNPNSVAIYVGPLFNYVFSDDIELRENLGFLAGLEIFLTESISLDLGMRHIDTMGFEGGLNIQF